MGSVIAEVIALGGPAPIGDKVDIWRDIERDGAGVVVDEEVEAVAAGSRGPPALRSAEREAIGLEARNYIIARASLSRGQSSIAAGRAALARGRRDCREPRMIGLVPRKRGPGPRSARGVAVRRRRGRGRGRRQSRASPMEYNILIFNIVLAGARV